MHLRSHIARLIGVAAPLVLLGSACAAGDGSGACGPITRESLDSAYLVHVLGDGTDVDYASDPPTSGPHRSGPEVEGVVGTPLPRPIQVGILERGDVLIQHRPDLPAEQVTTLGRLAQTGVVVAPNPDLPAPVVATAWTYKRTCSAADVPALEEFIDQRSGKGPEG